MIVHSMKDLPTKIHEGTVIVAVPEFELKIISDEMKLVISLFYRRNISDYPISDLAGTNYVISVIGTSSPRRVAQLLSLYPHLVIKNIVNSVLMKRGNIETRIRKLKDGQDYDGIILASAGLNRLGLSNLISESLNLFLYAVGQNDDLIDIMSRLTHVPTALRCICEREILKALGGGCCVPVGVRTKIVQNEFSVECGIFNYNGTDSIIKSGVYKLPEFKIQNEPPYEIVSDFTISVHCKEAAQKCAQIALDISTKLIESGGRELMKNIRHVCDTKPDERIVSLSKENGN
ncbi:Porphobilinogen deaminase [Thelohanellus kitauei]|uniref:hydroxymethylbilane synthase n=1 Tax=Thelohanellus kitauei TaxID=669202 RepID=A0A0C2IQ33_THEKT|nr:Porphobilinogen deaminase [Thelohanellus kitauei]